MNISTISDSKGKIIAMLGGGESQKLRIRMRPQGDQHWHEIELPSEAAWLKPHEIYCRLKIPSPGEAPVFSTK